MKIRTIHVTLVLSALIHAAALWKWIPHIRIPSEVSTPHDAGGPLVLLLEPPKALPASPPTRPSPPQSRSAPSAPLHRAPPKRAARPPVAQPRQPAPITKPALPDESPSYPAPEPVPVPPPAPRAAPEGDFSSNVEARRRARQQRFPASEPSASAMPEESEHARANRIVAANLGLGRKPSFGEDATGGGIFQIQRLTYDYAEYLFYGWNKNIQRNSTQLIAVRRGLYNDIRRAVIRSMISIIRDHEQGDFLWESRRLGRHITLSARPADDAGLESFLMKEFFDDSPQPPLSRVP